jgi:hypothetical protein
MYSSKLVDLFYSLSKAHRRALRKFVRSPYFNKRQDVIDLFDLLYKTSLENRTALRKEVVFEKLFGKEKYSADKVDYTMSFLNKLIEQFLVQQRVVEDEVQTDLALMKSYRELGLTKHFNQAIQRARNRQAKSKRRDMDYYKNEFTIEAEQYHFLATQKRDADKNLEAVSKKLDVMLLAQKLKDGCRLLAHQAVAKHGYDFSLLETLLPYLEQHPELLEEPGIGLYYYYYQAATQETDSETYYQAFKKTFLASTQAFALEELQDLYTLALNYCVRQTNLGQDQYQEELFDWYQVGLDLSLLMDGGKLSPFRFNNIAKLALRLGKIDWTTNFIKRYKKLLDVVSRDSYVHNAYSMLAFAKGNYEETLERLQEMEYRELFIALDAKLLLIKVYYHLGEYDVLESFISSFKVFLRRKDVMAYHQEIYRNFLRIVQKLVQLPSFDKEGLEKLRQEIKTTQRLPEKQWLLEQLKETN